MLTTSKRPFAGVPWRRLPYCREAKVMASRHFLGRNEGNSWRSTHLLSFFLDGTLKIIHVIPEAMAPNTKKTMVPAATIGMFSSRGLCSR